MWLTRVGGTPYLHDLISTVPTEPSGKEQDPAAWAPELQGYEARPDRAIRFKDVRLEEDTE